VNRANILFVDDEHRILDGLRRSLRAKRGEWDTSFAAGGVEALEILSQGRFDVVVSDMRMPGMDGAELLTQVSERHPGVARVVLSGHTEPDAAIKVAIAGHRFLTKPIETATLVGVVEQLIVRTSHSNGVQARRIAGAARVLPALPEQVDQLAAVFGAPHIDLTLLVEAVVHDIGLTAKLLQLSNSAFYGGRSKNASVEAVVNALGVPTIQALVGASRQQWAAVNWLPATEKHVRIAWQHAVATAFLVEAVASPAHRPHAHAAALLQDIGRLACVGVSPQDTDDDVDLAGDGYQGTPYREIGLELLHLWGLPLPIVAAVAERDVVHRPADSGLGVAGAVRAAHLLIQQTGSKDPLDGTHDEELASLLAHPQLIAQEIDWFQAAEDASRRASRQSSIPAG
jgi:HD-like signal output (HDOD) protein